MPVRILTHQPGRLLRVRLLPGAGAWLATASGLLGVPGLALAQGQLGLTLSPSLELPLLLGLGGLAHLLTGVQEVLLGDGQARGRWGARPWCLPRGQLRGAALREGPARLLLAVAPPAPPPLRVEGGWATVLQLPHARWEEVGPVHGELQAGLQRLGLTARVGLAQPS